MHQIENRVSMMSNRRGWGQGYRIPAGRSEVPSCRARESQAFIRHPLQCFQLDHPSFMHAFSSASFIMTAFHFEAPHFKDKLPFLTSSSENRPAGSKEKSPTMCNRWHVRKKGRKMDLSVVGKGMGQKTQVGF